MNRREFLKILSVLPFVGVAAKLEIPHSKSIPIPEELDSAIEKSSKNDYEIYRPFDDEKIRVITPDGDVYIVDEFEITSEPKELWFDGTTQDFFYPEKYYFYIRTECGKEINVRLKCGDGALWTYYDNGLVCEFAGYKVFGLPGMV